MMNEKPGTIPRMSSDTSPKIKPGYTNPAFRAMGIPPLKLPSRNWMIFWSVVTVSISGVLYDKQKQKQIRNHYQEIVKPLADKPLDVNLRPRKITVFIAPPPNDYLDTSLKVWRRYVKPILYFAGIDYDIVQEEKQGVIRTEVANRMRKMRKQLIDSTVEDDSKLQNSVPLDEYDPEQARKFKAEFDYRDVLGIFRNKPKPKVVDEDSLADASILSGGVICLGRGAYKEYIRGLHEGLLGPLEPPPVKETNQPEVVTPLSDHAETDLVADAGPSQEKLVNNVDEFESKSSTSLEEADDENGNEIKSKKSSEDDKVLKPFITAAEYSNVELPQELSLSGRDVVLRDPETNVPILLHQSILMIPIPNLIGFLNIPERIYRFYRKRYYCESVCSAVTDLVEQKNIRQFKHPQDLNLGIEEEDDWPKNWVKEGLKRQSEWTTQLKDDPRIVEYINVYNGHNKD